MITKIATGVFAFAAMSVMFAGTANAEDLPEGAYEFTNGNAILRVQLKAVGRTPGGAAYEVNTNVGYLFAANSEEGTKVDQRGPKGTTWTLAKNSNGWNFLHSENGANALSHSGDGNLKLRRNNGGGQGNADQLWQMKKL